MVDVRVSQLLAEVSGSSSEAAARLSQIVKEVSYQKIPPNILLSSIFKEVSFQFDGSAFTHVLSQLVKEVSIQVPPLGTACEVEPILVESTLFALMRTDWSQPVEMETAWLTDVSRSKEALAEDRLIAQRRPVRTISATVTGAQMMGGHHSTRLAKLIHRLAMNRNPIPLWQDRRTLLTTATTSTNELEIDTLYRRFYPGQRVGISRPDGYQIDHNGGLDVVFVTIESVANDRLFLTENCPTTFQAGWDVYPMIDCDIIPQTEIALGSDGAARARITALEVSGCSTLPASSDEDISSIYPYIDGYPVLDVTQNWANGVGYDISRESSAVQSGRTTLQAAAGERAVEVFPMSFGPLSREQFWNLLQFHDSRRGRGRGCWIIHPQTMWSFVGSGLDYIDVRPVGYAQDIPEFFDHIAYIEPDGTIGIRPITAASVETGPTRHRIHLNAISVAPPAIIDRVTVAALCRQDSDSAKETWVSENTCASFEMAFRGLLREETVEID